MKSMHFDNDSRVPEKQLSQSSTQTSDQRFLL